MNTKELKNNIKRYCLVKYGKDIKEANEVEIFNSLSLALLEDIVPNWIDTKKAYSKKKQAYYLSPEYLMGRALGNNLINLQIYDEVKSVLKELKIDLNVIESVEEDAGLGNSGLGRLASCFMDSAATMNLPVKGYGLRYSNGSFSQKLVDGAQAEYAEEWLKNGDPWSIRKDDEIVHVDFDDFTVKAVPYDMPIVAYGTRNVNTLRLFKSEALISFDYNTFNRQMYDESIYMKNRADDITRVLYPNNDSDQGKVLRLRQQYFMVSASLKDIIRKYKKNVSATDFSKFSKFNVLQLNDTQPVLAIPEFIRILVDEEGVSFVDAYQISKEVFAYTNHTILKEALEKWDMELINQILNRLGQIITQIDYYFIGELTTHEMDLDEINKMRIINEDVINTGNIGLHVAFSVNGVAGMHTNILKYVELNDWYKLYPQKFQNKTNGITPRRWLLHSNKELATLITKTLKSDDWITDLNKLKDLEKQAKKPKFLKELMEIKQTKKQQLADYIFEKQGIEIDPNSMFDIQIKRVHEYRRQLLNAFYILDLYHQIKAKPKKKMPNVTFIFGAKAVPTYARGKAIIRFIGEVQKLVNNDPIVSKKIKVVFVENYGVSYAEKLFPAADISKQISTSGLEASGTGNMKFMLNGTPTFGTYDGANVEISEASGEENNFIFGLRTKDIENLGNKYDPHKIYEENEDVKRVVDSLVDKTFGATPHYDFKDLYNSILNGSDWHIADEYYLLADFKEFKKQQEKVFKAYTNKDEWAKMCLMNIANSGHFSSDRAITEYAKDIWGVQPNKLK